MRIAIGSDHAGFRFKERIKELLNSLHMDYVDYGVDRPEPVDYPEIAQVVAEAVARGDCERGILICGTGIGMTIAANKVPGIRAALCHDDFTARAAREHNDANILTLGERVLESEVACEIVETWLNTGFEGGRHTRRLAKITQIEEKYCKQQQSSSGERSLCARGDTGGSEMDFIEKYLMPVDPEVASAILSEERRQEERIELIASENFVDRAIMAAQGCVMTNKYAEGYPGRRYYGGCEFVDIVENLACERAKALFRAEHVNVQPHSGSQANMAVYFSVLKPGDTILGMNLTHGGHLTHGSPVNMSGSYFDCHFYGVNEDGFLDYEDIRKCALEVRPRLIVAGASAYPRVIDFSAFEAIAREVGAYLMVDMAHIAGLVAAGLHPNPVIHAEFVTSTTHKTLRGPRGGMILCQERFASKVDKAVFPGIQGGPLMHVIAAKAVCFKQAQAEEFRLYQQQIIKNAQALSAVLAEYGFSLVSGGTDTHLLLLDLRNKNLTGKEAESLLDDVGITVNKNTIPFDPLGPQVTSGIRLGTPAVTTRGMKESEMEQLGTAIHYVLSYPGDSTRQEAARRIVRSLCASFPLYNDKVLR